MDKLFGTNIPIKQIHLYNLLKATRSEVELRDGVTHLEVQKDLKVYLLDHTNPHAHRTHARLQAEIDAIDAKIKQAKTRKLLKPQ